MKDRVPTKVLGNGAVRYGVYDEETGELLQYVYLRAEDEPAQIGTPLTKAVLLSDDTAQIVGLDQEDPTVSEALAALGRGKQDCLEGQAGQFLGFDAEGKPKAQKLSKAVVTSFKNRTGAVSPQSGDYSVSQITGAAPRANPVFTGTISLGRKADTTERASSVAIGRDVEASGFVSLATGDETVASGNYSNAFGEGTEASGMAAHSEGWGAVASADCSHAEGFKSKASGNSAHAEGSSTEASAPNAHAEGTTTTASGSASHAEGWNTKAQGDYSHAEGSNTEALGYQSHAEGSYTHAQESYCHTEGMSTTASESCCHAEGYDTTASGAYSHAAGRGTFAEYWAETAIGCYNVKKSPSSNNIAGDLLVVGKGNSTTERANIFRVAHTGVYANSQYYTSGADYAELFEWADGNPNGEDRVGRFVTLSGLKLRLAGPGDGYLLGIVSGAPSVVGDVYDDQWAGMYLTDVFGRPVWEDVEVPAQTEEVEIPVEIPGEGDEPPRMETRKETRVVIPAHTERRQKLNPAYDPNQKYVPRTERPEWAAVGMLGKLVALEDGSCQVDGWCTAGENGAATASGERTRFRVMEKLVDPETGRKCVRVMLLNA